MNDYQKLFDQIPVQYNLFAFMVFANIVLGILIVLTILLKNKSDNQAIYCIGGSIFMILFIEIDFFLSATGLMKYVVWMNNSTETMILFIPILLYFFIIGLLKQEKIEWQKKWMHFVIPALYFAFQLGIHLESNALKLNNYVSGFHPHLIPIPIARPDGIWYQLADVVGDAFHELLIATFLFYSFLSIRVIRQDNASMQKQFAPQKTKRRLQKYHFSIFTTSFLMLTTLVCSVVFLLYNSDLGEQYIMCIPMMVVFILGYIMMGNSYFFDKSWLLEKYHTSGLNIHSSDILQKVVELVEEKEYYLQKEASLKGLATQLSLSPTYLSQVINHQTQQNFNDFINQYRIKAAKKRLVDEGYSHLTTAAIGETVGFKSKSAFYAAFKKHAQITPAAYAKAIKAEKSL